MVEAAPIEAQIELFEALIDGCREAVKGGSFDPKVRISCYSSSGMYNVCFWWSTQSENNN